jgi:hypothetical protein
MIRRDRMIRLSPDQTKAGIYVEELITMIHWLRELNDAPVDGLLVNGVSDENLTFNAFGQSLAELEGFSNPPLTVPQSLLRIISGGAKILKPLFPSTSRFHPKRIEKLTLANDVRATRACELGYPYAWPLKKALSHWLEQGL